MLNSLARSLLAKLSPEQTRFVRRIAKPAYFGTLGRVVPLSQEWGFDRGTPIDRMYISRFLAEFRNEITGRTLEVRSDSYTKEFGVAVERYDIIDNDSSNGNATFVADLAAADDLLDDQFDCFVLTQTLHLIFDIESALRHAHRILKPGGVLLATVPVVSRIAPRYGPAMDFWRFTPASCARLFGDQFGPEQVSIRSYGNVFAGIAFLAGVSAEELDSRKLLVTDDSFPVVLGIRAVKGLHPITASQR
jgi:SAM-dependent methyltransferase